MIQYIFIMMVETGAHNNPICMVAFYFNFSTKTTKGNDNYLKLFELS